MLTVQKRNGRIEPLDISKIQKYTSSAIKGLDNVSQSELEVDAKIQFRDQITTEEIQKTFEEILISGDEKEFVLDKEKLLKKHKTIIVEIIRKLGFTGIEIEKVIFSENGKFFRSNSHEISIKRKEIYCKKKHEKDE